MDHGRGWLAGSDRAFEELLRDVVWTQRRRWMYDRHVDEPRLTFWQRFDEQPDVTYQWIEDARRALSVYYDVPFDSVGMNLYRDGADSVAWHRDRIRAEIVDPVVALVSLGEPRKLLLRPKGGGKSPRVQAWSRRPSRHRGSSAAPFRALRPESESIRPPNESRVQTRRRLTHMEPGIALAMWGPIDQAETRPRGSDDLVTLHLMYYSQLGGIRRTASN